jgi:hypothetical protein
VFLGTDFFKEQFLWTWIKTTDHVRVKKMSPTTAPAYTSVGKDWAQVRSDPKTDTREERVETRAPQEDSRSGHPAETQAAASTEVLEVRVAQDLDGP